MCRYLKTCKGPREWRRRRSRELLWHRGIEPRGTSRRENQKLLTAEIGERREGAAESTQAEKFVSLRTLGFLCVLCGVEGSQSLIKPFLPSI